MENIETKITVKLKLGLHARPCALINHVATRLDLEKLTLSNSTQTANANSIMGLMTLFSTTGAVLDVKARGKDAQKAIDAIREILETDKYEGIVNE